MTRSAAWDDLGGSVPDDVRPLPVDPKPPAPDPEPDPEPRPVPTDHARQIIASIREQLRPTEPDDEEDTDA